MVINIKERPKQISIEKDPNKHIKAESRRKTKNEHTIMSSKGRYSCPQNKDQIIWGGEKVVGGGKDLGN